MTHTAAPLQRVFAVDPGDVRSAFVLYDAGRAELGGFGHEDNEVVRLLCRDAGADVLVVEMIASYGKAVGSTVFETCVWIGRFVEAWATSGKPWALMYRQHVKRRICGAVTARDSDVRRALINRWGGPAVAIGSKARPGPLHGVANDVWQALAVAVTWSTQTPHNANREACEGASR